MTMYSSLGYCELCHKRIMYAAVVNQLEVCEGCIGKAESMGAWDYEYREINGRMIQFVRHNKEIVKMANSGNKRETLHMVSRDTHWHRCTECWRQFLGWDSKTLRVTPADNNGFFTADQPYPHAHWCTQKGKF